MCPPVARLTGSSDGVNGAGAPDGAALEHLVRELATQFARQNEQFTFLASIMADMRRQLRELTDAATRTTEWMRTHESRANDIDKSLDSLRERLDALQSASVSSVETKSVALPIVAGSVVQQTTFTEPHSWRECWQFSASGQTAETLVLTVTEGTCRRVPIG